MNLYDDNAVQAVHTRLGGVLTFDDIPLIVATVRRADRDAWMLAWLAGGAKFPERTEEWFNDRIRALGVETVTGDTT